MQLWKGDEATRTRDPGRGGTVGRGFGRGIDQGVGHASVPVVKGAVVELAVPAVLRDMCGAEFVSEAEDTVRTGFRGIKVVHGSFEGSELFDRKVFREAFDREVGEIVGYSMHFWSVDHVPFNSFSFAADCFSSMDW